MFLIDKGVKTYWKSIKKNSLISAHNTCGATNQGLCSFNSGIEHCALRSISGDATILTPLRSFCLSNEIKGEIHSLGQIRLQLAEE